MKLIGICAPYRANTIEGVQHNIAQAELMAKYYWLKGYAVFTPHLNSRNMDGLIPDQQFLDGVIKMMLKCDTIAIHPDWESSKGCRNEVKIFSIIPDLILEFPTMRKISNELTRYRRNLKA